MAAIVTGKQMLAIKLYRVHQNVSRVADVLGTSREATSRLINRGRRNLQTFSVVAAAADGGDPLDALEDVQRILKV